MKVLVLIRHAKAVDADRHLDDTLRPLSRRGIHDASLIASRLADKGLIPNEILSSPAERAIATARSVAKGLNKDERSIAIREAIYSHGTLGLTESVRCLSEETKCACIFGHNPDLTSFANLLSAQSIEDLPTSGIVAIVFEETTWKDLLNKPGRVIYFGSPSDKAGL